MSRVEPLLSDLAQIRAVRFDFEDVPGIARLALAGEQNPVAVEMDVRVAGGGEANPAAAGAGARAGMASRTNTLFSIPMLFFMGSASHLQSLGSGADLGESTVLYWVVALVVMLGVEANALIGPGAPTQKPLTTVSGTIHAGLGLTAVLVIVMALLI